MSKTRIVSLLFGLGIIYILFSSHSNGQATGSNTDNTGAPLSTAFCANCHSSGTGFGTVSVGIQVFQLGTTNPVSSYIGGNTYDMRVTVTNSDGTPLAYGFQMTGLTTPANTPLAGYSNLANNVKQKLITTGTFNGRTYVEHNGVVNNNQFNFSWTAPPVGTGAVKFYAAGNAVNDNNSSSGDRSGNTSLTLPEQLALVVSSSFENPSCFEASDGSISLGISGSAQPYTFLWDDNSTDEDRTGLNDGSYSVTVSGADAQQTVLNFTLEAPPQLVIVADVVNPIFPNETGSVNLIASGGTPGYTIEINNQIITGDVPEAFLADGCYTVSVTDIHDCMATSAYCIAVPDEMTADAMVLHISCNGMADGSITLDVQGATAPYSIMWSNNDAGIETTNLDVGTYTATVTDDVGYVKIFAYEITEPDALEAASLATSILCHGESSTVTINATGGNAPYSGIGNFVRPSGEYTFDVVDENGCIATATVTIDEPALLQVFTNNDTIPCVGGSAFITVQATGGVEPYEGTGSFELTTPGNALFVVTDANGCVATSTSAILADDGPQLISSIENATCNNQCTGNIWIEITNATSNYTVLWNDESTDTSRTALCAGIYALTVSDENGCTINSNFEITQPDAIDIAFEAENILCYSDTVVLNANILNAAEPFSLVWSGEESTAQIEVAAGEYMLIVNDANDCVQSATIVLSQPDSLMLQGIHTNVLCHGDDTGTIDLSVEGGTLPYIFDWSDNSTDEDITNAVADDYTAVVFDNHGCVGSINFTIAEPAPLEITVDEFVSGGLGVGTVEITTMGGTPPYNYQWTDGQTEEDVTLPSESQHSLTVTDANGCTITSQVFDVDNSIYETAGIQVSMFPVPFADVLHVASAQPITNLRVLNANGSLIFESHEGKLNYS
ncbi:MAG: choice-of-anchor V domain-containing protein, partial [Flavobacteriales bacterium]